MSSSMTIISFPITDAMNKALIHEAALMGCSRSNLLRIIIADYLSRNEIDLASYRNWLAFRRTYEEKLREVGENGEIEE